MTNNRKPDRGQVVASIISVLVVLAAAVGGSLAIWLVRDQLPPEVATHWGATGAPDNFRAVADLYVSNALIIGVLPLFMVVIGLVMKQGRAMAPIAAATAVFMSATINGTVISQRGLSAEQVPTASMGWSVIWGAALAVGVGLALWALVRKRASEAPVPADVAVDAPRLLVDDSVRLAWTGRTPVSRAVWIVLGLAGLTVAIPMVLMAYNRQWSGALLMGLTLLLLLLVGLGMSASVTVDARGVRASSLGFIRWARIPLETIAGATVGDVSPLGDFGGWGRRIGFNGEQGLVTAGGPALRLDRGEQGVFVFTLADAEAAAATVNTLIGRRG